MFPSQMWDTISPSKIWVWSKVSSGWGRLYTIACSEGILTSCSNHLNCLFLIPRSSNKILPHSLGVISNDCIHDLFFHSLCSSGPWVRDGTQINRLPALRFSKALLSTAQTNVSSVIVGTAPVCIWSSRTILYSPVNRTLTRLFHLGQ